VDDQRCGHAGRLARNRGSEQQVVARKRVDGLALERRAGVARVSRRGPHDQTVADASEGAERCARLPVADQVLGPIGAVWGARERLEATAGGDDVRREAVLCEHAHVVSPLGQPAGELKLWRDIAAPSRGRIRSAATRIRAPNSSVSSVLSGSPTVG
jgi:hypothetical protein